MYYLQRKEEAKFAEQNEKTEDARGPKEVEQVFVCILNPRRLLSLITLYVGLCRDAEALREKQNVRVEQ